MSNRETMLRRLQACDLALHDTSLFLDANPTHPEALRYYRKHKEMREQLHRDYVSHYGPLTHGDEDGESRWSWIDGPWPWQMTEEA